MQKIIPSGTRLPRVIHCSARPPQRNLGEPLQPLKDVREAFQRNGVPFRILIVIRVSTNAQYGYYISPDDKPHSWKLTGAQTRFRNYKFYLPHRPHVVLRNAMQFCWRYHPLRIYGIKLSFAKSLEDP